MADKKPEKKKVGSMWRLVLVGFGLMFVRWSVFDGHDDDTSSSASNQENSKDGEERP